MTQKQAQTARRIERMRRIAEVAVLLGTGMALGGFLVCLGLLLGLLP